MKRHVLAALMLLVFLAPPLLAQATESNWRTYWAERLKQRRQNESAGRRSSTPVAQSAIAGGSSASEGGLTEAAAATAEKLMRQGTVDGKDWSVTASFKDTPYADVLQWLVTTARGKPWEINVIVNYMYLGSTEQLKKTPFTAEVPGVSLGEALQIVMTPEMQWTVQDDGTVLVSRKDVTPSVVDAWPADAPFPTPAAAETRRKLARTGEADGKNWSVSVDMDNVSWRQAFDALVELAAREPHGIRVLLNGADIRRELSTALDWQMTVRAQNVSLRQAMTLILGTKLGYVIQDDGTVLVGPRSQIYALGAHALGRFQLSFDPRIIELHAKAPLSSTVSGSRARRQTWELQRYSPDDRGQRLSVQLSSDWAGELLVAEAHRLLDVPESGLDRFATWRCFLGLTGREAVELTVDVTLGKNDHAFPEAMPAARELLDGMVPDVQARLDALYQNGLQNIEAERDKAKAGLAEAQGRLEKAEAVGGDLASGIARVPYNIDAANAADLAADLSRTLMDLQTDREVKEARRAAIVQQTTELKDRVAHSIKDDPISAELDRVVKAREEQLAAQRKLAESARSSHEDVLEAEVRLAEARVRLAERRETVSHEVAGDLLGELNTDLARLSIDLAETEARMRIVAQQKSSADRANALYHQLQANTRERKELGATVDHLRKRVEELGETIETARPPTVELTFGDE